MSELVFVLGIPLPDRTWRVIRRLFVFSIGHRSRIRHPGCRACSRRVNPAIDLRKVIR